MDVARKDRSGKAWAIPYWSMIGLLILTTLTGGASRGDVQSLAVLRPASVIFCGIGLWTLNANHVRVYRPLFAFAIALFALVIFHLIPLPPEIWTALPGRQIVAEIDKAAEFGRVWRPISMVPSTSWNALYSLFVPFAVLILGAQLSREERFKLLFWLLGLGVLSGFWGILQVVGESDSRLYLYETTNRGSAVGLFSNRNHQAMILACLFPMLAVYASTTARSEEQAGLKLWLALGIGAVLVPLLLVTGSRAGLILGVIGLLSVFVLHRRPEALNAKKRSIRKFDPRYLLAAFAVLCLGALTLIASRAEALQRLFAAGQGEEDRLLVWAPIAQSAWKYFPFGSGIGSFVEVYQIDEPYALLSTEYYNHAHNDWLEVFLTAGLPGLLLLIVGLVYGVRQTLNAFRAPLGRASAYAKLGSTIILILALGSIGDYPLRTPTVACFFVVAALWLASDPTSSAKRLGSLGGLELGEVNRVEGV